MDGITFPRLPLHDEFLSQSVQSQESGTGCSLQLRGWSVPALATGRDVPSVGLPTTLCCGDPKSRLTLYVADATLRTILMVHDISLGVCIGGAHSWLATSVLRCAPLVLWPAGELADAVIDHIAAWIAFLSRRPRFVRVSCMRLLRTFCVLRLVLRAIPFKFAFISSDVAVEFTVPCCGALCANPLARRLCGILPSTIKSVFVRSRRWLENSTAGVWGSASLVDILLSLLRQGLKSSSTRWLCCGSGLRPTQESSCLPVPAPAAGSDVPSLGPQATVRCGTLATGPTSYLTETTLHTLLMVHGVSLGMITGGAHSWVATSVWCCTPLVGLPARDFVEVAFDHIAAWLVFFARCPRHLRASCMRLLRMVCVLRLVLRMLPFKFAIVTSNVASEFTVPCVGVLRDHPLVIRSRGFMPSSVSTVLALICSWLANPTAGLWGSASIAEILLSLLCKGLRSSSMLWNRRGLN